LRSVSAARVAELERGNNKMRRLMIVLLISATASLSSACIASRKFVRTEVKTSADALSTRIEGNEADIKEAHDGITRVDGRVTAVDEKLTERITKVSTETGQRLSGLTTEVQTVDKKAQTADQKAAEARTAAEHVGSQVTVLDQRFENRNNLAVANEKSITFRFDSAQLDAKQQPILDEIAETLKQNPDALIVLQGRTDSVGDHEYNVRLGERRVEAVRRYLAVEKGVPVYKIHEISFGAAQPIAANNSREGREKNRTVAMTILVPKEETAAATSNRQ